MSTRPPPGRSTLIRCDAASRAGGGAGNPKIVEPTLALPGSRPARGPISVYPRNRMYPEHQVKPDLACGLKGVRHVNGRRPRRTPAPVSEFMTRRVDRPGVGGGQSSAEAGYCPWSEAPLPIGAARRCPLVYYPAASAAVQARPRRPHRASLPNFVLDAQGAARYFRRRCSSRRDRVVNVGCASLPLAQETEAALSTTDRDAGTGTRCTIDTLR